MEKVNTDALQIAFGNAKIRSTRRTPRQYDSDRNAPDRSHADRHYSVNSNRAGHIGLLDCAARRLDHRRHAAWPARGRKSPAGCDICCSPVASCRIPCRCMEQTSTGCDYPEAGQEAHCRSRVSDEARHRGKLHDHMFHAHAETWLKAITRSLLKARVANSRTFCDDFSL